MTTARNPITGALIRTKNDSRKYADNWDNIFKKKEVPLPETLEPFEGFTTNPTEEEFEATQAALQAAIK